MRWAGRGACQLGRLPHRPIQLHIEESVVSDDHSSTFWLIWLYTLTSVARPCLLRESSQVWKIALLAIVTSIHMLGIVILQAVHALPHQHPWFKNTQGQMYERSPLEGSFQACA